MATFCSAVGKMRKVKEHLRDAYCEMRTIRKTLQKEGYQQYWFLNNLVELHREI